MIVLPLFADQFDNAQRISETGYGIRLDTYGFTDEELIGAVDRLLTDKKVQDKMKTAGQRMLNSGSKHELLADKVEQLMAEREVVGLNKK